MVCFEILDTARTCPSTQTVNLLLLVIFLWLKCHKLIVPKALNNLRMFCAATDSAEAAGYEADRDISNIGCCEVLSVFL